MIYVVLLQQKIKVCICKATGSPMVLGNKIAALRQEFRMEFSTPTSFFKDGII
jgi:hypothetical protein